jgi:hypothetical protein
MTTFCRNHSVSRQASHKSRSEFAPFVLVGGRIMNQQTNAKRLENLPPALLGEVFGFLAPPAQSRLRASSTTLAGAFCGAVANELVPLAASWHSIDSHVEAVTLGPFVYFPAVPEALRDWERKTVRSAIVSLRLLLRPGRLGVSGALAQVRVERVHIVNASNVYSLGNDFLYRTTPIDRSTRDLTTPTALYDARGLPREVWCR